MKQSSKPISFSQNTRRLLINYPDDLQVVTTTLELAISDAPLRLEVTLPVAKVTALTMLPLFQALTNFFTGICVEDAEKEGKSVSCQKGCSTCCKQLVPLTVLEAAHIKKVVADLPAARKAVIQKRFMQATQQLQDAKILEKLRKVQSLDKEERKQLAMEYSTYQVFCPFLEDDACSIHLQRPMACREYLVTSNPEFCIKPKAGQIEGIKIPRRVSTAVSRITDKNQQKDGSRQWVPLITALQFVAKKGGKQERHTGAEWLQKLFQQLSS